MEPDAGVAAFPRGVAANSRDVPPKLGLSEVGVSPQVIGALLELFGGAHLVPTSLVVVQDLLDTLFRSCLTQE
jgi:hypothetical protein